MQEQLNLITTGENGINQRCTHIMSGLNSWKLRLLERLNEMDETEWLRLVDQFDEYARTCVDVQKFLGSIVGVDDPSMGDIPVLQTVFKGKYTIVLKKIFKLRLNNI